MLFGFEIEKNHEIRVVTSMPAGCTIPDRPSFRLKYSARGPNVRAGKKARAATIRITTRVMMPKVIEKVRKLPDEAGMYFLPPSSPPMATGPLMGRKRARLKTKTGEARKG